MFKRPDDEANLLAAVQAAEAAAAAADTEAAAASEAVEVGMATQEQTKRVARSKGHARIALQPKLDYLRAQLADYQTLPDTVDELGEVGILVSVATLRRFLMEFLPDEYAEYLRITGRGMKKNRTASAASTPAANQEKREATTTIKPESAKNSPQGTDLLSAAAPRDLGLKNRNNS